MIVGCARTSTADQIAGLEAQSKELLVAGCEKIFQEQVSSITARLQLQSGQWQVRDPIFKLARGVGSRVATG